MNMLELVSEGSVEGGKQHLSEGRLPKRLGVGEQVRPQTTYY